MKTLKHSLWFLTLLFICIVSFHSCRKERKSPSWDIDVLAPLVKSTLTINNLIPDSLLQSNADNSLNIVYQSSLYSFSSDTLFYIPDTTIKNKYIAPIPTTVSAGGTIVPLQTQNIKSVNGDAELTQVIIRSGTMLLSIKSSITEVTNLIYTLPKVTDAFGNIFSITAVVPKATSINGFYSKTFDLSGYKIDLTGINGTSVNTMVITYTAIVDPLALTSANIIAGDSVVISNAFIDVIPQYAKGYFGSSVTNVSDSTNFSLFKHIIDGTLNIEDIDIDFSIENNVGDDARITIDELSSINTRTNTTIPLIQSSLIGAPININRAVDNNGNVTPSLYQFSINPSTSPNIKSFFENLPDRLRYKMDLEINPLGTNVSGSNDFIYYDKLMKTQLNMTIPLSLVANNLTLADTMNFKMDVSTDNVNYGTLYLYAENGFPFTAEAQLYLMNDNFTIIDSLISAQNTILAPQLDANLICAGKRLTKLTIPVSADKMTLLRSTKKTYLKIKFNTANQPNYVKIYSFYEMNVKLVGDFNYTVGK